MGMDQLRVLIQQLTTKPTNQDNSKSKAPSRSVYMKTMLMTVTLNEWDLFWMAWMLFFCVANGAAVLSCVVFLIAHYHESDIEPTSQDTTTTTNAKTNPVREIHDRSSILPRGEMAVQSVALVEDIPAICGKRKERDETFGMTSAISQGKWKQQKRRIMVAAQGSFSRATKRVSSGRLSKTRALSFDDASALLRHAEPFTPLRRVVSCGDVKGSNDLLYHQHSLRAAPTTQYQTDFKDTQQQSSVLKQDQRPSMLSNLKTQVRTFLLEKLQQAARNAVDEVLTSVFSFMTYAMLLFVVRQYSAVAIGVSLDLGAFSIEL